MRSAATSYRRGSARSAEPRANSIPPKIGVHAPTVIPAHVDPAANADTPAAAARHHR